MSERMSGSLTPVGRDRAGLDLDLVAVAGREQRPDRPVDQPGGEDLLGRGPPLALDEAAGELARGVDLLAIVDRQREEVEPLAAGGDDGGDQGHRVAEADDDGAAGLLGQLAGLDGDRLVADRALDDDVLPGRSRTSRRGHAHPYLASAGASGGASIATSRRPGTAGREQTPEGNGREARPAGRPRTTALRIRRRTGRGPGEAAPTVPVADLLAEAQPADHFQVPLAVGLAAGTSAGSTASRPSSAARGGWRGPSCAS